MIPRESNDKLCEFYKRWRLEGDYLRCVGCAKAAGIKLASGRPIIASRDGEPFGHVTGCKNASSLHPWTELRSLITPDSDGTLTARAFEIADEAMFELLQAHCIPCDSHRCALALTDESNRTIVRTLAEVDPVIVEAFEWLKARDYVRLEEDEAGEHIWVTRRPGEDG